MITRFRCWKKTTITASNQECPIVLESPAPGPAYPCVGGQSSFSSVCCYLLWALPKPSIQSRLSAIACGMSEAMNAVPPRGAGQGGWHMSTTLWTGFRQWFNNILSPPPAPTPTHYAVWLNTTQNIFSIRRENRNLPLVCLHSAACQPSANISILGLCLLLTPVL